MQNKSYMHENIVIMHCRRRFDFQSPSRMDRNVELCLTIEKTLREVILLKIFKSHAKMHKILTFLTQ